MEIKNINNEINNLFEKAVRHINIALRINCIVTFIVIIIVIVNSIKFGFDNYHGLLVQLIVLNICFVMTIKHITNTTHCSINRIINVQSQMHLSYNLLHNADNNI